MGNIRLFKKISEYVISLILFGSIVLLFQRRKKLDTSVFELVTASAILTVCSEQAFTLFRDPYGTFNVVGHCFKVISFYLIYRAIIQTGLLRPYDLLFRDLSQSEEKLRKAHAELELRVEERTAELADANRQLKQEAAERRRAQEQLRQLNDELERRVEERTGQLKEAQDELVRKERLAILGMLAGGVSHELRNPLGVIRNSTCYLKMKHKDMDEKSLKHLDHIEREVATSDRIIGELLDYARTPKMEITSFELSKVVDEVLKKIEIPENISLKRDCPEKDMSAAVADKEQIERIITNLISNAIFAMPEGGELLARCHRNAGEAILEITDTGTGISESRIVPERRCRAP